MVLNRLMKIDFNKLCFLVFILIFIASLALIIDLTTSKKSISFASNCSKPFSKDLWEPCECVNDCKIALICKEINNSKKCSNIMSDYIKERNISL